jgi:hypothetical protein
MTVDQTIPAAARRVGRDLLKQYFPEAGSVLRAEVAEELCLAMLKAWPGAWTSASVGNGSLILPLPTEARDD